MTHHPIPSDSHPIPSDSIRSITEWHQLARPNPDARAFSAQLGAYIEEFVEMMEAFGSPIPAHTIFELNQIAMDLKSDGFTISPHELDSFSRVELLDSLADQVVTAAGVAHCAGMDFQGALAEVNRSNWSKFENGAPVFLPGGKIGKGEFYTKPDLTEFV
ncbi:MAG: nucleoside triphosphate pyrophosphohydrolase family protein [Macromonas sp.]